MKIISPIAIDMGAKNTGVYYAKYAQGSSLEEIDKHGDVLVYDKYTPLLKNRTANRHARRGYQRRKLAKRLLVLVLEKYFNFPAKKHAQAIGFLLNRRGFTLQEGYYKEHLKIFPADAWEKLPSSARNVFECKENVAANLQKFSETEPGKIRQVFQDVESENKKVRTDLFYFSCIRRIGRACEHRGNGNSLGEEKEHKKLSRTSAWVVKRLNKGKVLFAVGNGHNVDLCKQINDLSSAEAKSLCERLPDIQSDENRAKKSGWNFNIGKFLPNEKNEQALLSANAGVHLHHLSYALYQLNSGARPRSQYFDEIKDDLNAFSRERYLNNERNPAYIRQFALAVNAGGNLDMGKLHRVVCHISNLELKPLRAYFNDETPIMRNTDYQKGDKSQSNFISHAAKNGGDVFSNEKLSRIASTWFLRKWVVSAKKDGKDKFANYRELKSLWQTHEKKGDIVKFWVNTDPELTIPPYQSMTNRRPPTCQSLVLNPEYLKNHYPRWGEWLEQLRPDEAYRDKLRSLTGGKGPRKEFDGRLISDDAIKVRQLQFVLDASKKTDSYNLNEIWSIRHKLNSLQGGDAQKSKWEGKLRDACGKSTLPVALLKGFENEAPGSFGHFVNKYYQTRKRAKSGRYFLHQKRKNHWMTDGKLFAICPHRPRQKEHQWELDVAAITGVDHDHLKDIIGGQTPEDWLRKIKRFKGACSDAADMQKKHRGSLKIKIALAERARRVNGKNLKKEDKELVGLVDECKRLALKLAEVLHPDLNSESDKGKGELTANAERFESLFSFAQINNIVFKDRKGFSNTCPVCSADNAFRMREIKKSGQNFARASRLPAMSIRLIDGAVMRICDVVSKHIAGACWKRIAADLRAGSSVVIPLVFEQNRFEFEPSLKVLKGRAKQGEKDKHVLGGDAAREGEYREKKERIRKAAKGVCAYTGNALGTSGEYDHIIPQSSQYGTLNDEANLIFVSAPGNQGKSNQTKFLGNLSQDYKNKIFAGKNDAAIALFIYRQLEGDEAQIGQADVDAHFAFGQYSSFNALGDKQRGDEQQRAFRHALFLQDGDPLKQKVINALKNRNRTIVNGTQRYMAQCIADKIYKSAQKAGKEKQVEFDYFEYTARANEENSTYDLRRFYGEHDDRAVKPKTQPLHSHLIDAQMAFLLAAENHKADGCMGLSFNEAETIRQGIDMQTGEVLPVKFFASSYIGESDERFSVVRLDRKKSKSGVRLHRSFHRPNFYAEHYVPLFLGKKDGRIEVKAGFCWEESVPVPKKDFKNPECIMAAMKFAKSERISAWDCAGKTLEDLHGYAGEKTDCNGCEVVCIAWDKTKIQKYLVDEFSTEIVACGKVWSAEVGFIRKLAYRTQKKEIKTYADVIATLEQEKKAVIFGRRISIPAMAEWQRLKDAWKNDDDDFLENHFLGRACAEQDRDKKRKNRHQKKRRVFSLPVVSTVGHFLQKRNAWNNQAVHQILADSDSREDGNKFSRLVLSPDGARSEAMNRPFISKNTFKLAEWKGESGSSAGYTNLDPNKWIAVERDKHFPPHVEKIEYCFDNTTRPKVKIHLSDVAGGLSQDSIKKILQENSLTKAKTEDVAKVKEKLQSGRAPRVVQYTALGFNADIDERLLRVVKK